MTGRTAVDVVTFGCRLNAVESDAIRLQALRGGHRDLTVVNTCAVTAEATRQARQAIRRLRRERPDTRLVVTGCASETDRAGFEGMAEVDAVVPNAHKSDASAWRSSEAEPDGEGSAAPLQARHTRGFVAVQNGCDHRCTFCIIPFGRGESRSVPPDAVIAQVRALVESGVGEVVLTGVDVTAYGHDRDDGVGLGDLARRVLAANPDLGRLRLSSLDCFEADRSLLEVLAEEPRLMPHLHLSLQSGADLILKRMKRRHSRTDAIAFCQSIRSMRPDVAFGADLIAGFPTETEAHFEDTLSLVERCGLSYVHVFPYSVRPGTPAAHMPQVPGAVIRQRAGRLRELADERLSAHLDARVNRRLQVLTERGGRARAADFTAVRVAQDTPSGAFLTVQTHGHDGQALVGIPLES